MRCSTTYCFLAFSTSCAIASSYHKYRQLSACADPEAPLLNTCWDVLDIPNYLSEWQKTVPVCPDLEYTDSCCIPGEAWSLCFLRLGWEQAPSDCLGISETDLEPCQFPTGSVRSLIPRDTVQQVKYVTANIVNIHGLFQSLYQFLVGSTDLIRSLRKSVEYTLGRRAGTTLLNRGNYRLASLAGPALIMNLTSSNATNSQLYSASKDLVQSLQEATSVREEFWPPEYDSDDVTSKDIHSDTSKAFLDALSLMMEQDYAQFITFAADGLYSDNSGSVNFNSSGRSLDIGLNTYITTNYLQQSGWYGMLLVHRMSELANPRPSTAAPGRSAATFEAFQVDCEAGSTKDAEFCTKKGQGTYWSSVTQRTYTLKYKGKAEVFSDATSALLDQIVKSGWASLLWMFDGSYNCTAAGRAGGSVLYNNDDGSMDFSCLSQLPIYLPCDRDMSCPTDVQVDGECPFGYYDGAC